MNTAILPLITEVIRFLNRAPASFRAAIFPVVLTLGMQLTVYAGWNIVREGSVTEGLRVAFADSKAEHVARKAKAMQAELHAIAASDRVIHQHLVNILDRMPTAARVRLAVIHNGVTGVTGVGMLRFDVTHAAASPGRDSGAMVANQPLSDWIDYLNTLLAGQCSFMTVAAIHSLSARVRMEQLGMQAFLVCPTVDSQNMMLGALFVSWDRTDPLPDPGTLATMTADLRGTASQIAVALDMRPKLEE